MVPTPTLDPHGTVAAYDRDAALLAERYESVDPAVLYDPVAELLPVQPAQIADIGAGIGRDAAWFAAQGHKVVAVEPALAMREIGRARHPGRAIDWLDDSLPELARLRESGVHDLIVLNGVWHHLDSDERVRSLAVLGGILADNALILMRVRHGPTAPSRPGFALPLIETRNTAGQFGLQVLAQRPVAALLPNNRTAGVTWTWLALARR